MNKIGDQALVQFHMHAARPNWQTDEVVSS